MEGNKPEIVSVDEYIAQFAPDIQTILQTIRQVVRDAAPEAKEKISYQMPTLYLHGNLVHFAAFKNHIGFYPAPQGIEAFQQELAGYKGAKGSVQFPLNQPMPYDLIRRMTVYRSEENKAKAQAKAKGTRA
jgi:uncharacterized protein YdhG (YjbR/CyaY superfamily)